MATLTPLTDTFVIIYTTKDKEVYLANTYAQATLTTDIEPALADINQFESYSAFQLEMASLGQPTPSFNPFEDLVQEPDEPGPS